MERWVISDTHFGHEKMLQFVQADGMTPIRSFPSTVVMDEYMVDRWNEVVKEGDRVYHLGDVAMKAAFLPIVKRLNGKKRLIRGNHDIFPEKTYLDAGFKEVHAYYKLENLWLSHVPVHPLSIPQWALGNVHGHIHERPVFGGGYFNASVEALHYTPVTLGVVRRCFTQEQHDA